MLRFAALWISGSAILSEAASISGTLREAAAGLFLEGARIQLEGPKEAQVFTRRGGQFELKDLPPGEYRLEYSYFGYGSESVIVRIEAAGEDVDLELILQGQLEAFELDTLLVEGSAIGQAKAFNQKQAALNLTEVIASDAFGQFVDRNAAEALQRVAGVSVQDSQGEGKFIIVRGANPAWNPIAIDGVSTATPEEGGRSTGLNIISIDQLERIEVQKTWLPRESGNFVGGSVNLITRSALDREGGFYGADFAIGQYDIAEEESYRGNLNADQEWGEDQRFGLQLSFDWSEDNRGSDTLRTDGWDPLAKPELKQSPYGFIVEGIQLEDFTIRRERMGVSGKIEWEPTPDHRLYASFSYNQFDDDEVLQETRNNSDNATNDYTGPFTLTEARALELGYDLTDPEVAARVYGSGLEARRLLFSEAVALGAISYDEENQMYTDSDWTGEVFKTLQTTVTEDSITTYQFGGDHQLGDDLELGFKVYQSIADKQWDEKNVMLRTTGYSSMHNSVTDGRPNVVDTQGRTADPASFLLNRDYGRVEDNQYFSDDEREGGTVDAVYTWDLGELPLILVSGLAVDLREKSFRRDFDRFSQIDVGEVDQLTLADDLFYGGELTDFLPDYGDYVFGPIFDAEATRRFVTNPGEVQFIQEPDDLTASVTDAHLRNYEATEDIYAGYLMGTLEWRRWQLILGVRYERTENTFTNNAIVTRREELAPELQDALPPTIRFIQPVIWRNLFANFGEESVLTEVQSDRTYDHFLPALHVVRRIGEQWVVRGAVTKTIARPQYDELAPREIVSISGARFTDSVDLANFDLRPMESINLDLSADYYFKGFGVISAAVYYKYLDGPVYDEIRTLSPAETLHEELTERYYANPRSKVSWSTSRRANAGDGYLYGAELTFEKRFQEWPSPFDGLGLSANASIIESEVELLAEDRFGEKVPLFLQSDRLANLSLFYEKYGFLVKLSWLYRGAYLDDSILAGDDITELEQNLQLPANSLDRWISAYTRLDALIEYRPFDWLTLYVEGVNLTNEPQESYYGRDEVRLASIRYTEPVYFVGAKVSF
jgi:TonB-dependent receptor